MALRFLISRLSSLGDVACTLPVAGTLKEAFPDSEIVWVADPRFAGVVECCDAVDRVEIAKPGLNPRTWPRIEGAFDAALDMQGLLKSAIPVAASKAELKLGYHWQREGAWLFSRPVLPDPTSFHIVDQYVDVARAAIAEIDPAGSGRVDANRPETGALAPFRLAVKEEDRQKVQELLNQFGVPSRFLAINAGAGWATKRWPATYFAETIDALGRNGVRSVLLGGNAEADREAARAVALAAKETPVDLLGKTSVRELIALLSLASAHLGGDTGSTHLMAALGRPAVGLYSITRPQRSCPYGQIGRCHYNAESLAEIETGPVIESLQEAIL